MKRLQILGVGLIAMLVLSGSNCSRARVESMTAMNEGVGLAQQLQYVDAVKKLETATAIDSTNDQAFYNLAMVHIELRAFDRAREDLQKAITANPEVAGYQEKLGTVILQMEEPDLEAAKQAFERAIQLDPDLFKAYYKLAQVHERLDDPQHALELYTQAIQHGPRFLEAYSELGRLYADLGFLDQASRVLAAGLEVAIPQTQEEANLHYLLGSIYQQQRDYERAIQEFRAALAIIPGMRDALFALGWTYSLVENREEARRYLQKFVDVAGPDTPAHYTQAAQSRLAALGGT
jgi:tetratricopeptide (TPR) repeat protein